MIKKKNYKNQDHFSQFYSFYIPTSSGKKIIVYYKRYRPKPTSTQKVNQIYDIIHNRKNNENQQKSPFPVDRTLQLITFDDQLKGLLEPIMKKIGKIRKFQFGTGQYKSKTTNFCLVVFKYQFDLVKCFNDQFIQAVISQQFKHLHGDEDQKQDYRQNVIKTYLKNQLQSKTKKIKQLKEEGYNLITNKMGEFKVDYQANRKWVQDLPQVKKQDKRKI